MVSKELFVNICDAFKENIKVYKEIDALIEYSYRAREYYKRAIKPVIRVLVNDIAGPDVLDTLTYTDDWGHTECLYDYVMQNLRDYFENDAATVLCASESSASGRCHKGFDEVYTPAVFYEWLLDMDALDPTSWTMPSGELESGFNVIPQPFGPI